MSESDRKIHALHRYYLWASRMRDHFLDSAGDQGEPPPGGVELRLWLSGPFAYVCYWFATLRVVVEGYQDLKLQDTSVDGHLSLTENVKRLQRFRNGVYHYQSDYFDARFADFLKVEYAEWAKSLHDSHGQFFLRYFDSKGLKYSVVENDDGSEEIVVEIPDAKT